MKLWPSYSSRWGRLWDMIAGLITAFLVNAFILLLSDQGVNGYLFSLSPWVVNGLFILVFLLVLPWFSLGYLLATLMTMALAILASLILLTGRLLPSGVGSALEKASMLRDALSQSNAALDKLAPGLTRVLAAIDRVSQIPNREIVGYLLLIVLSLLLMIFLLQSLARK